MKMQIIIIVSLIISLTACEEGNDSSSILENDFNNQVDKQYLIGKWVNLQLNIDTLYWEESIIRRTDITTHMPKHSYSYELCNDSIKIQYNGEYYIYVYENTFKISINSDKSIINIEGIDKYFPAYKGNQFKKITNKN